MAALDVTVPLDSDCIILAVPKKGRLVPFVQDLLNGSGLEHTRAQRQDIAQCRREKVIIVYLPAADIAKYVGAGDVHIGITGQDIVVESEVEVQELLPLGFGKCRLCLQAPAGKFASPAEVSGKRIVTSFPDTTKKFFAQYDAADRKTSVRYVNGSVEVAPRLGLADAIVDLVETGTTMRAAGLEVVAEVMTSEAVLIANPKFSENLLVKRIHERFRGFVMAQQTLMVSYNIERARLTEAIRITPGHESATITPLAEEDWVAVSALLNKKDESRTLDELKEIGARSILTFSLSNCRF